MLYSVNKHTRASVSVTFVMIWSWIITPWYENEREGIACKKDPDLDWMRSDREIKTSPGFSIVISPWYFRSEIFEKEVILQFVV